MIYTKDLAGLATKNVRNQKDLHGQSWTVKYKWEKKYSDTT